MELIYVNARQECLDGARSGDWPTCRDALQVSIDALSDDLALAAAIVALALVPVMIKRLVPGDAIFGIVSVLVPLCSGIPENPLVSLPRYLVVVYPLFIALVFLTQNRRLFALMVGASTVGLIWLLSIFARAWFVA